MRFELGASVRPEIPDQSRIALMSRPASGMHFYTMGGRPLAALSSHELPAWHLTMGKSAVVLATIEEAELHAGVWRQEARGQAPS